MEDNNFIQAQDTMTDTASDNPTPDVLDAVAASEIVDAEGVEGMVEYSDTEMRRKSAEQTLAKIEKLRQKRTAAALAAERLAEVAAARAEVEVEVIPEQMLVSDEPDVPLAVVAETEIKPEIEKDAVAEDVAPLEHKEEVAEPTIAVVEEVVSVDNKEESVVPAVAAEEQKPSDIASTIADVIKAFPPYIPVYPAAYAQPEAPAAPKAKAADKVIPKISIKKRNDEVSIKEIFALFMPKLWIIAICAVLLSILLGGYAMFFKADTYTSKATFMVSTTSGSVTDSDIQLSYKIIDIIDVHVSREDFLVNVANTINEKYQDSGWSVTPKELKGAISISKLNDDAPAFVLSVTTGSDVKSKGVADVLCVYLAGDMTTGEEALIKDYMHDSYRRVTMRQIDTPRLGAVNDKGVMTNAVVGFLVGAVASMVIVYMVAMFDVIIHDRKKLEDHFDLPILGVIPRYDVQPNTQAKGGESK